MGDSERPHGTRVDSYAEMARRWEFAAWTPDPIDMSYSEVSFECDKSLFGRVPEKTVLLSPASVNASIRILSMTLLSNTIDMLGLLFRYPMICLKIDNCPLIGSLAARFALDVKCTRSGRVVLESHVICPTID